MEKFAVIDTETNWNDEVMSIGVVIAEADTFNACELRYYILAPEYLVGGMYSHTLRINLNSECNTLECSRKQAIQDLLLCLQKNNVTRIFAYNASFDYRHLPELNSFIWYDIMRLAAYRQYNNKIKEEDCYSTGHLRCNYGVESIKKLLTGLEGEQHNALCDAIDELDCIIKPLGYKVDEYIPYSPCKPRTIKNRPNKVIKQLKLTVQDVKISYEVLQPRFNDLFNAFKIVTKNKSNFIVLERTPALNYISYVKVTEYANKNAYVYFQFDDKQNNATYNCRKKLSLNDLWKFIIDFRNDKMPDIDGFEIFD